uniref:Chemokine (C-C motif) receptor 12b, tandem duplicate 2 n=1 Tax=Scleropages formosus TaxID=113540 RepID=A0A8C9RPZ8_SCLFO
FSEMYIDNETISVNFVKLCHKKEVNQFGSQFLPTFYYCMFLFSLLGNVLVLYIMRRYEKLNTVTNTFLLNLVVSDLVFTFSLPFWAAYHSSQWIFGRLLCKLVGGLYFVGFYSSILFLTLMTFDRYLAVVHAVVASRKRKKTYALVSLAVVWCVSILATFKEFLLFDVRNSANYGTLCEESHTSNELLAKWQVAGDYQQFFLFFLFPLTVVLYCYIRIAVRILSLRMTKKFRVVKIIFVIVATFFICWSPYNVVIILKALKTGTNSDLCEDSLDYALYITRNLSYLYFCINPIFYTFVGKKFRNHFQKILAENILCINNPFSASQSSKTSSQKNPESVYE